jgi:hypothetical protein
MIHLSQTVPRRPSEVIAADQIVVMIVRPVVTLLPAAL